MPIVYWHPQDDDAPPKLTGNLHIEGDGDAWWAGVQLCFAPLIAGLILSTVATSTCIAQLQWTWDNQELVRQPVFEDDSWPPSVSTWTTTSFPVLQQWAFETNDVVPQAAQQVFEDDSWPGLLWRLSPVVTSTPQQWVFEANDIVPQPAAFAPDEVYWFTFAPAVAPLTVFPQPWSFDGGDTIAITVIFVPWIAEDDS